MPWPTEACNKQTKATNGRCPDGQPHRWQVGDPGYEWRGAQYVEITRQRCINLQLIVPETGPWPVMKIYPWLPICLHRCLAERENVCPIPADVWKGGAVGTPIQWYG